MSIQFIFNSSTIPRCLNIEKAPMMAKVAYIVCSWEKRLYHWDRNEIYKSSRKSVKKVQMPGPRMHYHKSWIQRLLVQWVPPVWRSDVQLDDYLECARARPDFSAAFDAKLQLAGRCDRYDSSFKTIRHYFSQNGRCVSFTILYSYNHLFSSHVSGPSIE